MTTAPGQTVEPTVLTELRVRTRPLHDALERRLNLLDARLTRDRYVRLLERFYGFYQPIEARIAAYGDRPEHWIGTDRRKAHLLVSDLLSTGLTPADIAALPRCSSLPVASDPMSQLGYMYVLEGATLGGQTVLKHVAMRPDLAGVGTTFFASYGRSVGAMWRQFGQRLEFAGAPACARRPISDAAHALFLSLDEWMLRGGF